MMKRQSGHTKILSLFQKSISDSLLFPSVLCLRSQLLRLNHVNSPTSKVKMKNMKIERTRIMVEFYAYE